MALFDDSFADEIPEEVFLEDLQVEGPLELGGSGEEPEKRTPICEPGDNTCSLEFTSKPRDSGPAPTGGGVC